MSINSTIEWTESTWNPVTGCSKISPGCKNCYAERFAKRLKGMGNKLYENGFRVTLHKNVLEKPLTWQKQQRIFVNSMSDLFHEEVPDEFIIKVIDIMRRADWHIFQILTKRSDRLMNFSEHFTWPDNVWVGVSIENSDYSYRLEHVKKINANVKFISFEPLIGEIENADFSDIDWVIVGGESGPHARGMQHEWVKSIFDNCYSVGVPFFFKQWGGFNKKKNGRQFLGKTWDQMPF